MRVPMSGDRSAPRDAESRLTRLLDTHALLAQVSRELGPALDLASLVERVLGAMRGLVEFRGGTIQLIDGDDLYIAASDPPASAEVMHSRLPIGKGLSGRAAQTGETFYSPDLDSDPRVDRAVRSLGSNADIRSYLAIPLICLGEVIGVLQVDAATPDAFDDDDRTLLEGLAAQVASAIESARRFEQVMELERLKSDFIARVSHELRTPITIVGGFVSTLLAHGDALGPDQRASMLERVDTAVTRLAALIEDLITLSRLETGVVTAHPETVVLADVLEGVRRTAADPELVTVEVATDVIVTTDPELLTRALSLFVDNALKYGGSARIRADEEEILVADEGEGIPDDVQSTLFELFTRSASTTAVPGLGLGLPMARTLLDVLGAHVKVESAPSGGTVVRIRLPR